jgi:hypothetical protein
MYRESVLVLFVVGQLVLVLFVVGQLVLVLFVVGQLVLVLFAVGQLSQQIPGKTEESTRHFSQKDGIRVEI